MAAATSSSASSADAASAAAAAASAGPAAPAEPVPTPAGVLTVTFQDDTELKANKSLLLKHFGLLAELLDGEEDLETDGDADLESNPTHTAWAVAYAQVLDVEPFTVSGPMTGEFLDKQGVPAWACEFAGALNLLETTELLECAEYLRFAQLADFMAACIANYVHSLHPVVSKGTFALSRPFTREEKVAMDQPDAADEAEAAAASSSSSSSSASAAAAAST